MSDETVTIRLAAAEASDMDRRGELRTWLEQQGMDTRRMTCAAHGADLVYEGAPVTKGNSVTKGDRQ